MWSLAPVAWSAESESWSFLFMSLLLCALAPLVHRNKRVGVVGPRCVDVVGGRGAERGAHGARLAGARFAVNCELRRCGTSCRVVE